MTEPLAFLNGNLLPQSEATLALNDAGFIFGATVTDLCRTFRHRLYRWGEHLQRFSQSCKAAYLNVPLDHADITRRAEELVAHNAGLIEFNSDLALVLIATPGPIGFYLGQSVAPGEQPTFAMHTFPLPFARYRPWIERGVWLATPEVRAIPTACVDPRIKHRSRLHWWLAQQQVAREAHPLLLDIDGNVTETAAANFLIVKDGVLIAPTAGSVLDGVSLKVVGELCGRLGIPLVQRPICLDDCYGADEALLTCTSFCVAGVGQINDRVIAWPGPMLKKLHDAWSIEAGVEIHGQILASGSV